MSSFRQWFEQIKPEIAVAGLAGGIVALSFCTPKSNKEAAIMVFAGVSCATFFTPWVNALWAIQEPLYGGVAFLLGLGAMPLSGALYRTITRKVKERELALKNDTRKDRDA